MRIFCPATLAVLVLSRSPAPVAGPDVPGSCRTRAVFPLLSFAAGYPAAGLARGCTHAFVPVTGVPAPSCSAAPRERRWPGVRHGCAVHRADMYPPPLFICPGSPVHAVGRVALAAHASAPESLADAGGPAALG